MAAGATPPANDVSTLLGYYNPGDGGGGDFYWDNISNEPTNGGTILAKTGITTGRWKRIYNGAVNIRWFGAKGDFDGTTGTGTDDVLALQKAIDNFLFIYVPTGKFFISIPLLLRSYLTIFGQGIVSEICTKNNVNILTNSISNADNELLAEVQIKDLRVANYVSLVGCTSHQIRLKNPQSCKIINVYTWTYSNNTFNPVLKGGIFFERLTGPSNNPNPNTFLNSIDSCNIQGGLIDITTSDSWVKGGYVYGHLLSYSIKIDGPNVSIENTAIIPSPDKGGIYLTAKGPYFTYNKLLF